MSRDRTEKGGINVGDLVNEDAPRDANNNEPRIGATSFLVKKDFEHKTTMISLNDLTDEPCVFDTPDSNWARSTFQPGCSKCHPSKVCSARTLQELRGQLDVDQHKSSGEHSLDQLHTRQPVQHLSQVQQK